MSFYQIDVISNRCNSIKSMSLLSNRCDFISMSFHQIDEFLRVRWNIQGTGIQDTINNYKRKECCTQQSVLKPSTKKNKEVAIRGGGGRGVLCLYREINRTNFLRQYVYLFSLFRQSTPLQHCIPPGSRVGKLEEVRLLGDRSRLILGDIVFNKV